MKGSICGINASVYDPLLQCLDKMDSARQSRNSLASSRPGSTLSVDKSKKFRPCLVVDANPKSNYTTICLMATFGGADYDSLADLTRRLVRPVQHHHPSHGEASTIPVSPAWPRNPQWVICWENDITTALSPWSGDVPYSVNAVTVQELRLYTRTLRKTLFKAASADRGLEKRLRADLLHWKKAHEGEGSIYSQAQNGSKGSLLSTRSYSSSSCSASLMSISEVSEGTPTPTGTTFSGKLMKNLTRVSRSTSHFSRRHTASLVQNNIVVQDPPMTRMNASRVSVSSRRSGRSRWAQGPPAIRAM